MCPRGSWGRLGAVLGQSWGGLGGVDILLVFPIESALGEAKNNSHGGNGAFLLQNPRGNVSQRAQRLRRDYVLSEVWENRKKTQKKMKFLISVRKHCNRTLKSNNAKMLIFHWFYKVFTRAPKISKTEKCEKGKRRQKRLVKYHSKNASTSAGTDL